MDWITNLIGGNQWIVIAAIVGLLLFGGKLDSKWIAALMKLIPIGPKPTVTESEPANHKQTAVQAYFVLEECFEHCKADTQAKQALGAVWAELGKLQHDHQE